MNIDFAKGLLLLTTSALLLLSLGCQRSDIVSTEYGKSATTAGTTSLNGTSVFAQMFRQRGKTVRRAVSISPALRRYDVVVWFPDSHSAPSPEEVDALEDWLKERPGRTLIYVGRSYDAKLDYLKQIEHLVDDQQREEYQRTFAEARVDEIKSEKGAGRFFRRLIFGSDNRESCDWFTVKSIPPTTVDQLAGPISGSVDPSRVEIRPISQLEINQDEYKSVSVLLKANRMPFVSSIKIDAGQYSVGSSQIIVVNDGSFLLNFGLANSEHRKLAVGLIDQIGYFTKVVFLESGPGECPVRHRVETHRPWNWIAQPPICYVVPHVLLWGVLFCFAMFPIFGRPRKFKAKQAVDSDEDTLKDSSQQQSLYNVDSMGSFRSHIVAMGKLYQRTEKPDVAAEKVMSFQRSQAGDTKFKKEG